MHTWYCTLLRSILYTGLLIIRTVQFEVFRANSHHLNCLKLIPSILTTEVHFHLYRDLPLHSSSFRHHVAYRSVIRTRLQAGSAIVANCIIRIIYIRAKTCACSCYVKINVWKVYLGSKVESTALKELFDFAWTCTCMPVTVRLWKIRTRNWKINERALCCMYAYIQ